MLHWEFFTSKLTDFIQNQRRNGSSALFKMLTSLNQIFHPIFKLYSVQNGFLLRFYLEINGFNRKIKISFEIQKNLAASHFISSPLLIADSSLTLIKVKWVPFQAFKYLYIFSFKLGPY